ncbi:hypothetical protein [Psychrobacter sp. 78a-MNA-CIBAN-0178]|uniref:hypothetical protein n=1 Tax=Psychrobacter sp. 78a-MNA-CIBAN-0178 TaxID=3140450 RepID=UPI003317D030|tara:strand:- start:2553 stop:3512 length:960 start_codon:yes stop_codon:yes gene_type:complete
MKYSIDYHQGNLTGWVATDDVSTQIKITDSVGKEYVTTLGKHRKSVVDKGICSNLYCGFSFEKILPKNIEGNFYLITISNSTKVMTTIKFCGDAIIWRNKFESFQIPDRRDFSCQDKDVLDVFRVNSDLIAFKILMIRLRRGKRAYSSRGVFKGHEYSFMDKDWVFFQEFYTKNFIELSKVLAVRSLWSVVDTFADFGDPLEKTCALAISNYMFQERFAQTVRAIYKLVPLKEKKESKQIPYWGSMLSNRLLADDAYDVFMTRNIEILEYSPILKKTFGVIILNAICAKESIANMNIENSEHFNKAFKYYKSYFKSLGL